MWLGDRWQPRSRWPRKRSRAPAGASGRIGCEPASFRPRDDRPSNGGLHRWLAGLCQGRLQRLPSPCQPHEGRSEPLARSSARAPGDLQSQVVASRNASWCLSKTSAALPGRVCLQVQPSPHTDGGVPDDPWDRLPGPDGDIQDVVCLALQRKVSPVPGPGWRASPCP